MVKNRKTVMKPPENDVVMGIDGNGWIKTNRTKTKKSIPILPTAEAILKEYDSRPNDAKAEPGKKLIFSLLFISELFQSRKLPYKYQA